MKSFIAWSLAFFGLTVGVVLAQEDFLRNTKGIKKAHSSISVIDPDKNEESPWADVTFRYNEEGDCTEVVLGVAGGAETTTYAYQYDQKKRKTEIVKKMNGALRSKAVYTYAENGSYELALQEYKGEKAGKETPSDIAKSHYNAKGNIVSSTRHYHTFDIDVKQEYSYDNHDFLVEMKETGGDQVGISSFTNDAKGNHLERILKNAAGATLGRETWKWNDKGDWTEHCSYDAKGTLLQKETASARYNEHGHPTEFTYAIFAENATKLAMTLKGRQEYEYYEKK